ncbi:hypothetical protein L1D14_07305 [Vibrio tubiashii]|uniref:hypothetical protein n=1 Tax=Vibrio tubiashii TaxID=29498 RepID=UPI001EFC6676|nr:hypothetical protein [Vibrio tubiashii]MCG9576044.1 hypothetical protein [Vibrio tubiashii]
MLFTSISGVYDVDEFFQDLKIVPHNDYVPGLNAGYRKLVQEGYVPIEWIDTELSLILLAKPSQAMTGHFARNIGTKITSIDLVGPSLSSLVPTIGVCVRTRGVFRETAGRMVTAKFELAKGRASYTGPSILPMLAQKLVSAENTYFKNVITGADHNQLLSAVHKASRNLFIGVGYVTGQPNVLADAKAGSYDDAYRVPMWVEYFKRFGVDISNPNLINRLTRTCSVEPSTQDLPA